MLCASVAWMRPGDVIAHTTASSSNATTFLMAVPRIGAQTPLTCGQFEGITDRSYGGGPVVQL